MSRPSLAVCAIFKNEARYLLEWIAYHRVIGFDRFVLYDNGSTDGGAELIRGSGLSDFATVIHWPQRPGQLTAYRHFIDIFAPAYDWVAFIDLDEFILPLGGSTVLDTLERCGDASAVLAHWRVFGPAGREEPAPGLLIETYDMRVDDALPVNRHVKSIVRCADLLDVTQNPHEFRVKGKVCNALGQEVPNIGVQPSACHQGLVINHYYTKSRQEWLDKVNRGSAMFDYTGPKYTQDVFDHLAAASQVKDETIKAYAPRVRELLPGLGPAAIAPAPAAAVAVAPPSAPPPPQPAPAALRVPPPAGPAPNWQNCGPDAQEHVAGLAMVFRDRSRPKGAWLAALRGDAARLIDPEFLLDEAGRLRDFPSDEEARAACDAALTEFELE